MDGGEAARAASPATEVSPHMPAAAGAHLYEQPLAVLMHHYKSTLDLKGAKRPPFKPVSGAPSLVALRHRRPRKPRSELPSRGQSRCSRTSRGVDSVTSPAKAAHCASCGQQLSTALPSLDFDSPVASEDMPSPAAAVGSPPPSDGWGLFSREQPECGFDHLVESLQRVLPLVERDGFNDRWRAVGEWIDKYDNDRQAYHIGANAATTLGLPLSIPVTPGPGFFNATTRRASAGDRMASVLPTKDAIGAACVVMDVLFAMLGRYAPVVLPAAKEVRKLVLQTVFSVPDCAEEVPVPNIAEPTFSTRDFATARDIYKQRRPYCLLVDDMRRRLGHATEEMEAGERKQERLVGVMDRGMFFWKQQLKMCILRVWASAVKRWKAASDDQKAVAAAEAARRQLSAELDQARTDLAAAKAAHAAEVKELKEKLETAEAQRKEAEASMRDLAKHVESLVQAEKDKWQASLTELSVQADMLKSETEEFSNLCKEVTQQFLEGPQWEVGRQEKLRQLVHMDSGEYSGESVLQEWINACVRNVEGIPDVDQYQVGSMVNVFQLLDAYILAMHFMAPEQVPGKVVEGVLAPQPAQQKAEKVLEAAADLDMHLPLNGQELAHPQAATQHLLVSASLMQRFCDPLLARACSQRAFRSTADTSEHPLWPRGKEIKTAAAWRDRLYQGWERACKWRSAGAVAHSVAIEALLAQVQGKEARAVSDREKGERQRYTADVLVDEHEEPAIPACLRDLFPADAEAAKPELDAATAVLQEHFKAIRNIFIFYSTSDTRQIDETLSFDEMWKFVSDCRLTSAKDKNGLSRAALEDLMKKVSRSGELSPTLFVRLLFRMAAARVKGVGTTAEKLETLLTKFVLPNSNYSDAEEFRGQLYSTEVQNVLSDHRDLCVACFRCYGRQGPQTKSFVKVGKEDRRMTIDEFCQLANDLTITDSILTHEAVKQIYMKLGSPTDSADVPSDVQQVQGLGFQSFLECLCGLAAFKTPAPYLPLFRRVSRFFDLWFVPILTDAGRFKKIVDEMEKLGKERLGGAQSPGSTKFFQ